jgi:glucan 1,3-beta-glucosidase
MRQLGPGDEHEVGCAPGFFSLCHRASSSPPCVRSRQTFGVTIAGEFSATFNDCGTYVRGVGAESTNPQCPEYDGWQTYNDTMREGVLNFVRASQDALQDWFFWTWKVRHSCFWAGFMC